MTEYEDAKQPSAEKRRSTRIIKSLPITVTGTDALGQDFRESTHTVMVNCYGCKYQSVHYVPKGTHVSIEVHRTHKMLPSRTVEYIVSASMGGKVRSLARRKGRPPGSRKQSPDLRRTASGTPSTASQHWPETTA